MVQAAATGALDFKEADPFDRHWILRVKLILEQLHHAASVKINELIMQEFIGSLPFVDDDSRQRVAEQITEFRSDAIHHLMPWTATPKRARIQQLKRLRKLYVDRYGDPESAENQAKVDALIARWEQDAKRAR